MKESNEQTYILKFNESTDDYVVEMNEGILGDAAKAVGKAAVGTAKAVGGVMGAGLKAAGKEAVNQLNKAVNGGNQKNSNQKANNGQQYTSEVQKKADAYFTLDNAAKWLKDGLNDKNLKDTFQQTLQQLCDTAKTAYLQANGVQPQ